MLRTMLIATTLSTLPFLAHAQGARNDASFNTEDSKVFVTGEGRVTVVPDRIRIILSSDARSSDRETASAQVRDLSHAVREAVIGVGVPEAKLRTLRTSLGPIYDYGDGNSVPKIAGYAGSTRLEIVVDDPNVAGAAIDAAIKAGATGVNGPLFEVSDPKSAQSEARSMAMKDAIERAQTLAEAGNFGLGDILTVNDNTSGSGGQVVMQRMMMAADAAVMESAPTGIDSGEEEVTSSVSVVFKILPQDLVR